jgi:D-alanyl-D-alanine carboxypeptidase
MRQFFLFYLLAFLCGWLTSCHNVTATAAQAEVAATLSDLLQEAIDDSQGEVPGVSMSVIYPEQELNWNEAAGFADKLKKTPLHPDQPYRIASVTKTFVAAAILRLHETNKLNIHDPLTAHLSAEHLDLLRSDEYQVDSITLLHCLHHTSGLYDYAVATPAYLEAVSKNPAHRWSRTDQLRFAMDLGEPLWAPGGGFHYSDTGYILLGEVIERAVDSTLAYGLRSLLSFEELGLRNTWLETVEPPPAEVQPVVRRYFGRQDFTDYDASIDLWGGGGLLSTSKDVATFVHALFSGRVFSNPRTIDLFMAGPPPFPPPYNADKDPAFMDYRSGHHTVQLYGKQAFSHSGFWGTGYLYLPDEQATIVVNYTAGYRERLLKKVTHLLQN